MSVDRFSDNRLSNPFKNQSIIAQKSLNPLDAQKLEDCNQTVKNQAHKIKWQILIPLLPTIVGAFLYMIGIGVANLLKKRNISIQSPPKSDNNVTFSTISNHQSKISMGSRNSSVIQSFVNARRQTRITINSKNFTINNEEDREAVSKLQQRIDQLEKEKKDLEAMIEDKNQSVNESASKEVGSSEVIGATHQKFTSNEQKINEMYQEIKKLEQELHTQSEQVHSEFLKEMEELIANDKEEVKEARQGVIQKNKTSVRRDTTFVRGLDLNINTFIDRIMEHIKDKQERIDEVNKNANNSNFKSGRVVKAREDTKNQLEGHMDPLEKMVSIIGSSLNMLKDFNKVRIGNKKAIKQEGLSQKSTRNQITQNIERIKLFLKKLNELKSNLQQVDSNVAQKDGIMDSQIKEIFGLVDRFNSIMTSFVADNTTLMGKLQSLKEDKEAYKEAQQSNKKTRALQRYNLGLQKNELMEEKEKLIQEQNVLQLEMDQEIKTWATSFEGVDTASIFQWVEQGLTTKKFETLTALENSPITLAQDQFTFEGLQFHQAGGSIPMVTAKFEYRMANQLITVQQTFSFSAIDMESPFNSAPPLIDIQMKTI